MRDISNKNCNWEYRIVEWRVFWGPYEYQNIYDQSFNSGNLMGLG